MSSHPPLPSRTALHLALVLALLAAGRAPAASAVEPAPPGTRTPPNLVLLTLDTTRADHLGAWGWAFARTPNLDALAARGTRFVRCDTAAPITLPSHATILTGLFPPHHGVRDNGTFALSDKVETLAERLAARGYDTAAVVSAIVLAARHGLGQGFRVYDDDLGEGYSTGTEIEERPAEKTTAAALAALAGLRPPFFLWVHYYDPHEEYRPPTRFADQAKGPDRLYDGEIAYMDEEIGKLLAALPAATDVVAVGDHGEMLGEHGETTHGLLLYRGARRVPLILAGPDVPAGQTRDCLVRTVDVAPTLLRLAGVPPAAGLDGASLLPATGDETSCDRLSYSESFLPFFAYKWYPLRALANNRSLFLQAPSASLYDTLVDPAEEKDLAGEQPEAVARWHERLESLLATMGERLDAEVKPENLLSAEERRQLAALGYLGGGGGGVVEGGLPDPRTMVDVARRLHAAAAAVQEDRCAEALPDLQAIVQRDPHNFPALNLAGNCLEAAERYDSALALFERAARENPLSAVPVANVAGCLLKLGHHEEAEKQYRHALALDPTQAEAATNLARLLRQRGQRTEARRVLDEAIASGGHAPTLFLERGLDLAEGGRLADALRDFRDALRRDPANPVPLENAARAAYQLGQAREASLLYEQLVRLQPDRGDLWKTLGAIYHFDLGKDADALRCLRRALTLEVDPAERSQIEALVRELGG